MLPLFALAAFLSAALLFLVQPMMGKALLPRAGGSPAVWTTCMLFFQAALLAGYGLSHVVTRRLRPAAQVAVFGVLLGVAVLLSVRPQAMRAVGDHAPQLWVLLTLAVSAGFPFVVVSMVSPLLQRWFSISGHLRAVDPYFLSVASNAGSAVGLLAYPLVMERWLGGAGQWRAWVVGLAGVAVLLVLAGARAVRARGASGGREVVDVECGGGPVTLRRRLHWLVLAMVPSSLMLGVTLHISTDIAAVPLLWVGPLLLYLVSFMLAFAGPWAGSSRRWGRLLPVLVLPLVASILLRARSPVAVLILVHMVVLLAAATMCHRRLAELRPHPSRLTEFYLFMSLGGVLGGLFSAVVAPNLFSTVVEYPLMLAAACVLRPQVVEDWRGVSRWVVPGALACCACVLAAWSAPWVAARWIPEGSAHAATIRSVVGVGVPMVLLSLLPLAGGSLRFAGAVGAVLVVGAYASPYGAVLARERTFFGVHTVVGSGSIHRMLHGTTLHGVQVISDDPALAPLRGVPGTYYHRSGPIGDVIGELRRMDRFHRAGFVGLGAGTMAAYGEAGTHITFYEIDGAVARFAQDPSLFTFVTDARGRGARVDVVLGDGRLGLGAEADGTFDVIAVDAFSSDAIPVHLITREAVGLFLQKTGAHGVVAFHVSNRSFELAPVLVAAAGDLGLRVAVRNDTLVSTQDAMEGKAESEWVILARDWADMGSIARSALWERPTATPDMPRWTDDRSDVLRVFTGW
ncbi:MAG: hypothetical protein U0637_02790 [Phycisphaerales bacterium]